MNTPAPQSQGGLTLTQWLICVIAAIGFAFDIYELLMLPLILPAAIPELVKDAAGEAIKPGSAEFLKWVGIMFYVPAFVGGIIGLFGGYLTDRLGRRFVLTWSILLYAFSAFAAGFSTNIYMLLFLRCTTFIGVCVEFVAAVAWLAELFPNEHQREKVLGYTQAFSSIGGLLVALANSLSIEFATSLPTVQMPGFLQGVLGTIGAGHTHEAWRYTLMSGLIPAIPLIVIRPFLPESPVWAQKRAAGTLKRPSFAQIFSPELRRTTIVTMIMFACSYGAAFGAIQQMPQIVPAIKEFQARNKENMAKKNDPKAAAALGRDRQATAAEYTKSQEVGGLVGRFVMAILAVVIVSRRNLLRLFLIPGLICMPLIFCLFAAGENIHLGTIPLPEALYLKKAFHDIHISTLGLAIFMAGFFTVAQFSFWGNYLPRVYPVHLRGTGESFAANIGGRLIGTSFAYVATTLAAQNFMPGSTPGMKMAYTAAIISGSLYLMNCIMVNFLPEPKEGEFAN